MPTFNSLINRTDASALIPEEAMREIFQTAAQQSVVGRLARRLPNMARGVLRMPILSVLPEVYFVGEGGRSPQTFDEVKQTTEAAWANKYINAEELACIVVIPENVLDDADYDLWAEIRPQIGAAIGAKIDSAILFGESNVTVPAAWPDGIILGMPVAHRIALGAVGDLYDDIMGVGGVFSKVEEDGFLVNGILGALSMRASLRSLRDGGTGIPLFVQDMRASTPYTLDGNQFEFPINGGFDPTVALMIAGDWKQLVWAVRKDITFKVLTEGVITDNASPRAIVHNLAQDDMIALRVTFRMGWELPNPVNRVQATEADRYPFAALTPAPGS